MARKNVTETAQASNMTEAEVKAVIDRAANRISLLMVILRDHSEHPTVLRAAMDTRKQGTSFVGGVDSVLCTVSCDLDKLYKRLYPESEECWDGPDLSCDLLDPMAKINLALDHIFGRLDFAEKADDRALSGCVELVQDILGDLIEISEGLEVRYVA